MATVLNTNEFLKSSVNLPVMDVRSPLEYHQGHIPGAVSFPLLSDDERHEVGLLYHQRGKRKAILKGLELLGPKLHSLVENAWKLSRKGKLLMYCWRGGMRSNSMAWLLETAGMEVSLLSGGYKKYRQAFHDMIALPWQFIVLGGKTGSGKTLILKEIKNLGQQVIDLESLAHHKGSAFGWLGEKEQPTTEQFQNKLFQVMQKMDSAHPVWIEDESMNIGKVILPEDFWTKLRNAVLIVIEIPEKERIDHLLKSYALFEKDELMASFLKIKKKLGGNNIKLVDEMLKKGNFRQAVSIALLHYDKTYAFGLKHKEARQIIKTKLKHLQPRSNAMQLIKLSKTL